MRSKHPNLTEEQYIKFLWRKQEMQARYDAAQRLQPLEHRPWDRGFNPYERNAA